MSLRLDPHRHSDRGRYPAERRTLRPGPGLPPLDALTVVPEAAAGVLVYFPGFNTPLGPWEALKCQHLAGLTGLAVVLTEIPGMSRFGDPIPKPVRTDLRRHHSESWAELNLTYIAEAFRLGGVRNTATMQVLGYSTGCSLATAALPVLSGWGPIEGLNLVEPVAISERNVARLQAHNLADWGRLPRALATNVGHDHVMAARRGQYREPSVHYSATDLMAIGQVLASEDLRRQLADVELARCAIARGSRSSLCRLADFTTLDGLLERRGIPGPTITVQGLGHQLWHSFPTLVGLAEAMLGVAGPDEAGTTRLTPRE